MSAEEKSKIISSTVQPALYARTTDQHQEKNGTK